MNKDLKTKIEKVLKKEQPTPTIVYIIYYIIQLKTDDVEDKIIHHLYLLINRYIKKGISSDWILQKIKNAYEINKEKEKKIDKVLSYVKKILDNNK